MSDMPFGFSSRDPGDRDPRDHDPRDPDRRHSPGDRGADPEPTDPFAVFGAGGFDVGALGQMLTQLGQMLSQGGTGGGGPVNYELAKQMAVQKLSTTGLPSAQQASAVTDAVHLAELWLDPVTALPAGTHSSAAWAPRDWVEQTLPTWQRLCDPVAHRMAGSWIEALPSEVAQTSGPLVAMVQQMGGMAFGSQLGTALAQLGGEVLTSTEIGLPLGPLGVAALLPAAIEQLATGLGRKSSEVTIFLAAREAAHHRLFGHVPWLRQRLLATVEEFAQGIQVDTEGLQELARHVTASDPQGMDQLISGGLFEQRHSPAQKLALSRLETLLALVEGWVEVVVADALGQRLPGSEALRETLRRRRASGGPAEHTFVTLVGLELRPRKLRAGAQLWRELTAQHGVEGRDALWNHPDLLPTAEDLDDPGGFVERAARHAADLEDPIAALERTAADAPREQSLLDDSEASGEDPPASPAE